MLQGLGHRQTLADYLTSSGDCGVHFCFNGLELVSLGSPTELCVNSGTKLYSFVTEALPTNMHFVQYLKTNVIVKFYLLQTGVDFVTHGADSGLTA